MTSIRSRLGWGLGVALAVLLGAFGLFIYLFVRHLLYAELDATLHDKARLFAASTEVLDDGAYEFELIEAGLPEYWPGRKAEFVQLWDLEGGVVLRSPSLFGNDLGPMPEAGEAPQYRNVELPDGRDGRKIAFEFAPRAEEGVTLPDPAPRLRLEFAISREAVERTLNRALLGLAGGAAALVLGVLLALWLALRIGLRPLESIARQAASIGPANLGHRFGHHDLPDELQPIVSRLNELLSRLQASFERERRFTADAAHELRTPVAELRALAEVGLLEEHASETDVRAFLADTRAIARHLESLIGGLLALARFSSGRDVVTLTSVDIAALAERAIEGMDLVRIRPDLSLQIDVPQEAEARATEDLASMLIDNLLSNVAAYAAPDSSAVVCMKSEGGHWRLTISNAAPDLTSADLAHLSEPFWRKSAHRGGQQHLGIGLALVSECARLMQVELRWSLSAEGVLTLDALWPAAG
ncbi:MAG: HAMP domain-containing protein [Candidatus Hydrogenedens sp.]|nr:HAMP domain-containing protein [Candidatus Hydrogenedens sp.]